MFTWNLIVFKNLHVKWSIFQIDLLNILIGSYCNCYIFLWTNWFDFRPLYSKRYSYKFKMHIDLTLSVSRFWSVHSLHALLSLKVEYLLWAYWNYSQDRWFTEVSERFEMIWLCSYNPVSLQELALRRWGQGWDMLIARALKFHYCCSCWSNSKNKHSRGLSNHSHFHQSYILTPCVYFPPGFCFICF